MNKHYLERLHQASNAGDGALADLIGRPRTVLDVGCGTQATGAIARARGAHVVGVEVDPLKGSRARRVLDEVVTWDPSSPEELNKALNNRTFELIIVSDDSRRFRARETIAAIGRHAAPEGHVIVMTEQINEIPSLMESLDATGLRVVRTHHGTDALSSAPSIFQRSLQSLKTLAVAVAPETLGRRHWVVARRPPTPGRLSITVGMLTMNEEESVSRMIEDIRKVASDAKILCVDSSTKDNTHLIAERLGASVIRQLPPRGHGPAMEVLMYEASKMSDALIYLDCDFTYPTHFIPEIRRLLEEGIDVVNASRTWKKPTAMPLPNYVANWTFAMTAHLVSGVSTCDVHSGMRGYRSSVIRAFDFSGEGDALPIDTLLWPAKCGYRVIEVPIEYHERVGNSKLRKFAGTAWTFIRLGKSLRVGRRNPKGYERRKAP